MLGTGTAWANFSGGKVQYAFGEGQHGVLSGKIR